MSSIVFSDFNFTNHCRARYAGSFAAYETAYHLGYELAQNGLYANKDWLTVEMYARREWKLRYPEKPWVEYKDAVKFAWQAVRNRLGQKES